MSDLDPRLNAFREDLADARLRDQVRAKRFVVGEAACVAAPVAPVRRSPSPEAALDTEFLLGDRVRVFDRADGWAWIQGESDGYVGYVPETTIGEPQATPSHRVSAPRTFVYPRPDMKLPPVAALSLGCGLTITGSEETRGTPFAMLADGMAVIARHVRPLPECDDDFVEVAERLLATPYLWGGTSGFGIDCSGLVQLALRMSGKTVLRDTPMQEMTIGRPIDPDSDGVRRGDLVFWKGHVAICRDNDTIVHANGHMMDVAVEKRAEAIGRIGYLYGPPTAYRRP